MQIQIHQWLLDRKISEEIQKDFLSYEEYGTIIIPIKDSFGKIIFYKYRRNPASEIGPKYWYSKGGHVAIYNISDLDKPNDELLFITESELCTLTLKSFGFNSVSSTGGAGSFQEDWAILFKNKTNVIIAQDNDSAGIKGSIKIQQLIPQAKILFIPYGFKDVTEFLQKNTIQDFLNIPAYNFPIPKDLEFPLTKKNIREKIKEFGKASDDILELSRTIKENRYTDSILKFIESKYQQYKTLLNKTEQKYETNDKIAKAKNILINTLIKFNNQGYAKCLWHTDKNPSLYYYANTNHVKCFSCSKYADSIDVIMKLNNLSFLEAIDYLNNI